MKQAIEKYLQYLQSVRNSSPHTILNYGHDLEQFMAYLSPPGEQPPALPKITHLIIREFVGHLHEQGLEKSSIARKLAALRSFFKYCVRERMMKDSPARLVPTPKLPKRIPSVLSAEEMNGFLNDLADTGPAAAGGAAHQCGVSELRGQAADAAFGGANRKEVRQAGERQLGLAPAFPAPRIRDAFAGGWRGFARDSGAAGAPIPINHAKVHARINPATDGNLRQIASARVSAREDAGAPTLVVSDNTPVEL